jgi:hypothetical protein
VKKRKWEGKRRRGKKKKSVLLEDEPERENVRGERKKDKINVKAATVFTVAYLGKAAILDCLLEPENRTKRA